MLWQNKVLRLLLSGFIAFVFVAGGLPARAAEAAWLDPGFGDDGTLRLDVEGAAVDIALQPDGKIMLLGQVSTAPPFGAAATVLVRLLPDGALDLTFGDGGKLQSNLLTGTSLLLQGDGKIIVAGHSTDTARGSYALIRFNLDGSIDTSFGDGGSVVAYFGEQRAGGVEDIAAQEDGKLVVAGGASGFNSNQFMLARYSADGQIDSSFGVSGTVTTTFVNPYPNDGELTDTIARRVAIQDDGRILAVGSMEFVNGRQDPVVLAMARYNSNGTLDESFGTNGQVNGAYFEEGSGPSGWAMALQPDGKIVVGGSFTISVSPSSGMPVMALSRFNSDGTIDSTFAQHVQHLLFIDDNMIIDQSMVGVMDIVLQPEGKIVVAGSTQFTPTQDFKVGRFNPDGTRDNTFAPSGWITTDIGKYEVGAALASQPDGKILLAGSTSNSSSTNFAAARYDPTSPCEPTFKDVDAAAYYAQGVRDLYCRAAVSGYNDNTFRPNSPVTRAQLVKMVVLSEEWNLSPYNRSRFSDIQSPFYDYVETAWQAGIISGYGAESRPNQPVTRGQLSKIIVLARGWEIDMTGGPHFKDVQPDNPFYGHIETAYKHGIISGYDDGTFRWGKPATRSQVSKILFLALQDDGGQAKEVK